MDYNEQSRQQWDAKAAFWDNLHGDSGNTFHRILVSPAVENLLHLRDGERVLDVGCGSGALARRLSELGGQVTAVDFSAALIERAQARGQSGGTPIRYAVVDATDEQALVALGAGAFDAITCTMALMDMAEIAPLFRAVRQLMAPGGRFVFATMHPAFNSNNPIFVAEAGDRDGQLYTETALRLRAYLEIPPALGVGARDEPTAHYYYHRPLHELLNTAFAAGLVLDGLAEPAFPRDESLTINRLHWDALWQFPPVLAGRLRSGG